MKIYACLAIFMALYANTNASSLRVRRADGPKVIKSTDINMVSDQIDQFLEEVTEGDSSDLDATIMLKPFLQMEKSLGFAPLAVAAMGKLNLMAAQVPDFRLDDFGMRYEHLTTSSSFRASVAQLSDASWWALRKAHTGTFDIELLMAQVKDYVKDAMQVLYTMPPEAVEALLPIPLNEIKSIAKNSKERAAEIVEQFEATIYMQSELKRAALAKQGRTEELEIENEKYLSIQNKSVKFANERLQYVEARKNKTDQLMETFLLSHDNAEKELRKQLNTDFEPNEPATNSATCVLIICVASGSSGTPPERYRAVFKDTEAADEYPDIDAEMDKVLPPALEKEKNDITEVVNDLFVSEVDEISTFFNRYNPDILEEITDEIKEEHKNNKTREIKNENKNETDAGNSKLNLRQERSTPAGNKEDYLNDLKNILTSIESKMQKLTELPASEQDINVLKRIVHELVSQFKDFVEEIKMMLEEGKLKGNVQKTFQNMKVAYEQRISNLIKKVPKGLKEAFEEATGEINDIVNEMTTKLESNAYKKVLDIAEKMPEEATNLINDLKKKKLDVKLAMAKGGSNQLGNQTVQILDRVIKATEDAKKGGDFSEQLNKIAIGLENLANYMAKLMPGVVGIFEKIFQPAPPLQVTKRTPLPEESELVIEVSGPGANKIGGATFKLHSAAQNLNRARKESREAHNQKLKAMEEQHEAIIAMIRLKFEQRTINATIDAINQGLKALGSMEKEWKKLITFFDEMSSIVDISLGSPMRYFLHKVNATAGVPKVARKAVLKGSQDFIFKTAYKASSIAYMLQYQSGLYKQISTDLLLPMQSSFGELIALNKDDKEEIEARTKELETMAESSTDQIKEYIQKFEDEFSNGIVNRIQKMKSTFDKYIPKVDAKTQKLIEDELDRSEKSLQENTIDDSKEGLNDYWAKFG